jgi:septal ring factor EnvC (AmiA/AmiB activator)
MRGTPMWFVSKQRYDESLIEREVLKDQLPRSMATVRTAEAERDQARALVESTETKLAGALQDVANAEHEIEKAEQQVSQIRLERDALQANLDEIRQIVSDSPAEGNGRGAGSRMMGAVLGNGAGRMSGESQAG